MNEHQEKDGVGLNTVYPFMLTGNLRRFFSYDSQVSGLSSWFYGEVLVPTLRNASPFLSQALLLGVTAVFSELGSKELGVQSIASMINHVRILMTVNAVDAHILIGCINM